MNVNRSSGEVESRRLFEEWDNGVYLWLIIGCSLGGALLLTLIIATLLYLRRRYNRSKTAKESRYIPGSEFCPQPMVASFSSSSSDETSETQHPVGKQYRRPLGPSTSLDPPGLLRLTSECVQPRPTLTRWHTVATPHCQTATVPGTLNTDRDSDEEDVRRPTCLYGRLWFSVVLKKDENRLEVTLHRAKHLPGRGLTNSPRDPFVKVYLLPDEENFHQSRIRKKTLAPKFNETFVFQTNPEEVSNQVLKLSVYDFDKRKVRHCLGHVVYSLNEVDKLNGEILCKDLELAPQPSSTLGEIQVCLSCNPFSNRIKTTICRVRNLQGISEEENVVYVKIQLHHGRKMIKTKRTVPQSLASRQQEISFDETFNFAVSGRFFDSCSFTFTVMAAGASPLVKDTPHGRVVIGPFMYARGEQLQHWQEMLGNPKSMVTRWHALERVKHS